VMGRVVMPRLAAEVADKVNVYNGSDRAAVELLAIFKERCVEAGRDFAAISKSRSVSVVMTDSDHDLSKRSALGGSIPGMFGSELADFIGTPEEVARYTSMSLDEQHELKKSGKVVGSLATERLIVGTTDEIADELREMAQAGFDELIIQGLDSIEALQTFARDVMPKVKGHVSAR